MTDRHSIWRATCAVLLAGSTAVGVAAGAGAARAATPADVAYAQPVAGRVVSPAPLNIRYGPGTNHWVRASVANGTTIAITCKIEGTNIGGDDRWYQLDSDQSWVSAYYVTAYGSVPWCDGDG